MIFSSSRLDNKLSINNALLDPVLEVSLPLTIHPPADQTGECASQGAAGTSQTERAPPSGRDLELRLSTRGELGKFSSLNTGIFYYYR